jgi:methylenetetrahydrofolate dehydrogenase (NADP+)/methenyltetrahydrofolate cyclohydrolase
MSAEILDGIAVANSIKQNLAKKIAERKANNQRIPALAVILVGKDPASEVYVSKKRRSSEEVGILSLEYDLPEETTQEELLELINKLAKDKTVDGILVQLPLPKHIQADQILEAIPPDKDVDGFHPYNLGRLAQRRPLLRPCTPHGIMSLLRYYHLHLKGLHAVIVGASNIVGRPMMMELLIAGTTVTLCHRFTKNLQRHVSEADLLVVAIGKRHIIESNWIKPGCIVIDVGMHRLTSGKLCGDLDFKTAKQRAGFITPVPGGVGPMTVVTLLENTVYAAEVLHQ